MPIQATLIFEGVRVAAVMGAPPVKGSIWVAAAEVVLSDRWLRQISALCLMDVPQSRTFRT